MSHRLPVVAALLVASLGVVNIAHAEDKKIDHEALRQKTIARAIQYLQSKGRDKDGSFSNYAGTGITSLVANALLKNGRSPDDPVVAEALKWVLKHVQKDGGIYVDGSLYRNYETSVAILALAAANKDGKYDKIIKNADKFLKGLDRKSVV